MSAVPHEIMGLERHILDSLVSAILLLDRDLRVTYANNSAEMMLALSTRHMYGMHITEIFEPTEGSLQNYLQQAGELNQPITERELRLDLPDGRGILVDCTIIPLHEQEAGAGVLIEIQQVDRHLKISREESLLHQQQATQDLVRGLAHEIKNPLGGLRGAAQLLEAELDEKELKEYTQIIIEEADRLQALVNRMIGPNRLPDYTNLNIHQVLERVRSLVRAETGGSVMLVRDYDPSIPDIRGDSDQLIQSFLNIVRNATRAVPAEDGRVILRTRIQRSFTIGNTRHRLVVQVDIEDNGPGIPDEIREKIFFPMVTSGTGGMGLGLSIAQSLISRHNGLIECDSRPGKTVFTVYLPVEMNE